MLTLKTAKFLLGLSVFASIHHIRPLTLLLRCSNQSTVTGDGPGSEE